MKIPRWLFLGAGGLMLAGLAVWADDDAARLAHDFALPPDSARPWVWGHWLHGNVDRECITRELEAMKRVGLGGVTMFDVAQPGIPPGPHAYLYPEWQKLFAHEIAEAKRLGLEVMTQNGPGYCGNGGPWITPEFAAQKLVESAISVPGGGKFAGRLPQPAAEGGFYRDVAVLAINETPEQRQFKLEGLDMKRLVWLNYIRWKGTQSAPLAAQAPAAACIPPANIVDLTGKMAADGTLEWEAPPGTWTLLRFGHAWTGQKTLPATPASEGPECDKLDKRGIQTHFNHVMKRMVELAGPAAGKTFSTFFVDSWEAGGQNWTEKMPEEFKRRRGYDIIPFLPVMTGRVVGDLQTSERFLYDLRQTVSELVTENFWAEMQRLCHAQGMKIAVEPYITTGNDLDAANYTDEPMGEFWSQPFQPNDYRLTVKSAVSAADLNHRLIVGVEAFTASEQERWLSHPARMKAIGDQIFCLGANRFQIHRFAMQRFPQLRPGMTMGKWGQHYDSTQTWWEWSKPWHDYLARCQFLLRQGPVVADVLVVVPEEPLYRVDLKPIPGHDYDACGPEAFRRMVMDNGLPGIPGGPHYRLITVDHNGTMTLARLRQLRDLVAAGANLLGEPPQATPGLANRPQADAELKALAAELWGAAGETERPFGKGRVFRGLAPAAVLAKLGVQPDFASPAALSWIHRTAGEADLYFIASAAAVPVQAACTFRISGKHAELWDPETGCIRPLATSPAEGGCTTVQVPLDPNGSAFVVFRPGEPAIPVADGFSTMAFSVATPLAGPWTLEFPKDSGAPEKLEIDKLISWSRHPDAGVQHFSGTAIYRHGFNLPETKPGCRIFLDLGRVEIMARVKLNGQDLGILWKPPYRVEITEAAKTGPNTLEIAVVNLWTNRLIGDAALPEDARRDKKGTLESWPQWILDGQPSPTGRRTFVTFPLWKKDDPLQESGLLGPVQLLMKP
jgi:hypothetical protein